MYRRSAVKREKNIFESQVEKLEMYFSFETSLPLKIQGKVFKPLENDDASSLGSDTGVPRS